MMTDRALRSEDRIIPSPTNPDEHYFAIDLETTGLFAGARVIELATIAFRADGEVLRRFHCYVDCEMPIPLPTRAFLEWHSDHLMQTPTSTVLANWVDFVGPAPVLIAHHALFELNVLTWELGRCGMCIPRWRWIDTLRLAQRHLRLPNHRLQTISASFAWPEAPYHRADADAERTMRLWLALQHYPAATVSRPLSATWQYPVLPHQLTALWKAITHATGCSFDLFGGESYRMIPWGVAETPRGITITGWDVDQGVVRDFEIRRIAKFGSRLLNHV